MFSIFINKCKQELGPSVKTTFSIRLFLYILSLSFITLSCGSGAYEPEQNTSPTGSIYPHAAGFAEPGSHGQYTLANNIQGCGLCHGEDFSGKDSATACYDCHPAYPHRLGWDEPDQHGVFAQENGLENCAIMCHGEDFSGKDSATRCYDCHDLYPHVENWKNPESHGLYSIPTDKEEECKGCHGADLSGGLSKISCMLCHDSYPHSEDWENPERHGLNSIVNGQETCQGCHGTDSLGGNTGTSCFSCHDPYPHAAGWVDWDNHGNYVLENINDTCAIACHGENLSGKEPAKSCFECHRPYPHNPDWITVGNPSNHGKFYVESYVIPPVISNDECASNCHGTDFNGGGSTISCNSIDCHDEGVFPHIDQGQILWELTGHQNAVNITLGNDAVCTECHSDYLRGPDGGALITCTTYCH